MLGASDSTWLHFRVLIKLVLLVDVDLHIHPPGRTRLHALDMCMRINAVQVRVQPVMASVRALDQDDVALIVYRLLHDLHGMRLG